MPARQPSYGFELPPPVDDPVEDVRRMLAAARAAGLDERALYGSMPAERRMMLRSWMAQNDDTRESWRSDPALMMAHLTEGRMKAWRYVRLLSRKFREAVDGTSPRQVWNLPSRYGKTTILQWCIAQSLTETAGYARWMFLTYSDTLAMETGEAVRSILAEHYDQLGVELRKDVARKDRFKTAQGGGLLCRGIGSGFIGFGAGNGGGIILDDPMRSWQDAHSEAAREKVMGRFTGGIRHRLDQEEAPIIVCHARWHLKDISGQLIESMRDGTGEEWDVVAIPALAHDPADFPADQPPPPDPLGRAPGEPIEPERFTVEQTRRRHLGLMSTYVVAALEQQHPLADEGVDLKRAWFQLVDPTEIPTAPDQAITSWDLKLKDTEVGDYVVGQLWWRVGSAYFLLDQLRGQYDHATTQNAIALMAVRHPEALTHHIEAAGHAPEAVKALRQPQAGYEVSDEIAARLGMTPSEREQVNQLRRSGMGNLSTHKVDTKKEIRARTYIVPAAEAGYVRLPKWQPWLAALLDELAGFGGGAEHDDQVDTMSLALRVLGVGSGTVDTAASAPPKPTGPLSDRRGTRGPAVGPRPGKAHLRPVVDPL